MSATLDDAVVALDNATAAALALVNAINIKKASLDATVAAGLVTLGDAVTAGIASANTTLSGLVAQAATSAATAANVINGFRYNRYGNAYDRNYQSGAANKALNPDGTWKAAFAGAQIFNMKAEDDFAPGKPIYYAMRYIGAATQTGTPYFSPRTAANAVTAANVVLGAPDADGYRTAFLAAIPANTTQILFFDNAGAVGDDFEIIIAGDAVTLAACKLLARSRVPIIPGPTKEAVPKRSVARGGAQVMVDDLNGDPERYRRALVGAGGTISEASLAAYARFWDTLVAAGIDSDLIFVAPFLGNNLVAGLKPALDRYGWSEIVVSSTFNTWNEPLGLSGSVVGDTGIYPDRCGMARFPYYGAYILNDIADTPNNFVVGAAAATFNGFGIMPFYASLALFYPEMGTTSAACSGPPRLVSNFGATSTYKSTGMLQGATREDGTRYIMLGGEQIGESPIQASSLTSGSYAQTTTSTVPNSRVLVKAGPQNVGLTLLANRPMPNWKSAVIDQAAQTFMEAVRSPAPIIERN